ncbi:MAG: hypothetical protein L0346_33500, partial [Chloroflexi bacterium]|nr:hypothetical protein [Chloroflexota bacterium]
MKRRGLAWTMIRVFVVVCIALQLVGQAFAKDPYALPPADPDALGDDSYQSNGQQPPLPIDQITGEEPPLELPEKAESIAELVPAHLVLTNATRSELEEKEVAVVTPAGGAVSFLDGQVAVIADAGTFAEDVIVSLRQLPTTQVEKVSFGNEVDGAYLNEAGEVIGLAGERNELLRFELEAVSAGSEQMIDAFQKRVHIVVDLRGFGELPAGHHWFLASQDENNLVAWQSNGIVVHNEAGLLSTSIEQFSVLTGGSEDVPVSWRFNWIAPTVSAFSGAATYHYPIGVPQGRAGLTPNIDIFYSSRSLDSLILAPDDQGELGLGWTIANISITRSKSRIFPVCCPGQNNGQVFGLEHFGNFSLSINGQNYELELVSLGATEAQYRAINGPGIFVQQKYDATLLTRDKLYWIVKTPDGTTYKLGSSQHSERGQWVTGTGVLYLNSGQQLLGQDQSYGVMNWLVDSVIDVHGNRIEYSYFKSELTQEWNGSYLHTESGRITEIRYNFDIANNPASKIVFVLDAANDNRVTEIQLYQRGNTAPFGTPYRVVDIDLGSWSYLDGCGQPPTQTNYVNWIQVKKQMPDSSILYLPKTVMSYIDYGHAWPDESGQNCYRYRYLSTVDNGYGGKVEFVYAPGNGDGRKSHDFTCECVPEYGYSYPVVQTKTWDRTWDPSALPAITDYTFTNACYDQIDGVLGNWPGTAIHCPAMLDVSDYYPHGSLMGFADATITYKDYNGQVLNQVIHKFHQDARKMGRPIQEQLKDGNGALLQQRNFSYTDETDYDFSYVNSESTFTYAQGGQSSEHRVDYEYGRQGTPPVQYGNLTHIFDRGDMATTSDDRHVRRGYYPNTTNWIVGLVAWETTFDQFDAPQTAALYYYDDNTCYVCPPGTEGNLTLVERSIDAGATNAIPVQRFQYNSYGNVTHTLDGLNHDTVTTYDSTYSLLPVTVTGPAPSSHVQTFQYYGFNGIALPAGVQAGLLSKVIDPNNVATEYNYESFSRLQRVIRTDDSFTDSSELYVYYDHGPLVLTSGPFMITSWKKTQNDAPVDSAGGIYKREFYDGLGRLIQTQQQYNDWTGGSTGQRIITDMSYNAAGQLVWQSVPYLKPSNPYSLPTNPYLSPDLSQNRVTNQYDAAGQVVRSVGLDGAVTSQVYGRWSAYTQDDRKDIRASFFNAFGQLAAVDETLVTFSDPFNNSGSLNNWTVAGTVTVSSGMAHLSGNGAYMWRDLNDTQDRGTILSFHSTDANLEALFSLLYGTGSTFRGWGLYVQGGQLKLYERVGSGNPTYTTLMPFKANTWYRVMLVNSKSSNRDFSLVVWEDNNPAVMAEIRLPKDSAWYNNNWRFQINMYSSGAALDVDNYNELNFNRTRYSYDSLGNLTAVVDPLGYTTSMTYDGLSRKTSMTDPDMGAWNYTYDNASNLTSQTDNKNQTIGFEYDELNRLTRKWWELGPYSRNIATYQYDSGTYGRGRRTSMTALDYSNWPATFSNSASWTYDARGRVTQEQRIISTAEQGNKTYTFQFAYTEGDLMSSLVYPGGDAGQPGESVTTDYWWQTGAPKSLSGTSWYVGTNSNPTGATYNANGQLNSLLLGNGKTTSYTYDLAFRVETTVNDSGFQNLTFNYDKVGNITRITDAVMAGGLQRHDFSYDSLNRLTWADTSGSGQGSYDDTYVYDALGNLRNKTGVGEMGYGQASGIAPGAKPHAVTHLGGVQKFWYDGNGNMTHRIDDTGDWTLGWTTENQLQSAAITGGGTTIEFVYDADGMLVSRVEDTAGSETINETIYVGKLYQHELFGGYNQVKHYVFNGQLVARQVNSQVRFFLTDHLGSTTTTLKADGTKEADLRYDPWGEERWNYATTPTGYRYTGQRWDGTLGLHDYNARYYDPSIGRFISPDTVVPGITKHTALTVAFGFFKPGENHGDGPGIPQLLNRYTYVLNNPLFFKDPTGHELIMEGEIPADELDNVINDVAQVVEVLETLKSETDLLELVKTI